MSTFLYKLGKSAYDKPWQFLISWIAILGVVIAMLAVNGIHSTSEMKIAGTESQKVLDQLTKELPEASGGQASIAFTVPEGERLDTPERLALIQKAVNDVYNVDYVINPAKLAAEAGLSAADSSQMGAAAGQANQGTQTNQTSTAEIPPYGPLIVDGVPVIGVMLSSDGSLALFQFQFTEQQASLPKSVPDAVINAVTAVEQNNSGITAIPSDSLKSTPPSVRQRQSVFSLQPLYSLLHLALLLLRVCRCLPLFLALRSVLEAHLPSRNLSRSMTLRLFWRS